MNKKKLVEVALPLEAINRAAHADKSRKTGTIRNVHKWFAPMPVPALRALIFAALVDDPDDDAARSELLRLVEQLVESVVESPDSRALEAARRAISTSNPTIPTVVDPFCGGGSTLVEAQRLGLPSIGSDLNPIPVLISHVLTSLPARFIDRPPICRDDSELTLDTWRGLDGFLHDVRHYGRRIYESARDRIGKHYPDGPDGKPVFAWWWARTVPSPDPRFQGRPTPLVTSWWLTKVKGGEQWLEPIVNEGAVSFQVRSDGTPPAPSKDRCLLSNETLPFSYIRDQGKAGHLGTQLLAYTTSVGRGSRSSWAADPLHERAAREALPTDPPHNALPDAALGFRVQGYGFTEWSDLFLPRQLLALETFADEIHALEVQVLNDGGDSDYAAAVMSVLGLCLGKMVQLHSTLVGWGPRNGPTRALTAFGQQTISMTWDFCEVSPFSGGQGDWMQTLDTELRAFALVDPSGPPATVVQMDAREAASAAPDNSLLVTDPPYFAAIGYADLSDYFYPWLKRALSGVLPDLFSTISTPKIGELIANPSSHDSNEDAKLYFIDGFRSVFHAYAAKQSELPILIVYANKESESGESDGSRVASGWEAMLQAIVDAGLSVVATWPVHGTAAGRVRSMGSNALATYVVLVCRPRASSAAAVSRSEFLRELRAEIGPAIEVLKSAAIAPVDLAQAVIGPGMGVFTRFGRVLEADGKAMSVRSALLLINGVLGEVLHQQEGDFDAETRWALAWFEQAQYAESESGKADALARAHVTSIDTLTKARLISSRAGATRLRTREEISADTGGDSDDIRPVWVEVQRLVAALEDGGESAAAEVLTEIVDAEAARHLAYSLFAISERRGWAEEANSYNALVIVWPDLLRLAARIEGGSSDADSQGTLL